MTYQISIMVEEVKPEAEGVTGSDGQIIEVVDFTSRGHEFPWNAMDAGIQALIAAKHQRIEEFKEQLAMAPRWTSLPGEAGVIDCSPVFTSAPVGVTGSGDFQTDLKRLLNYYSVDAAHNTADHVLAGQIITFLAGRLTAKAPAGGSAKSHASGLDEAPVVVAGLSQEALDLVTGNAATVVSAGTLPKRAEAERETIPSKHYLCTEECAARGHMPEPEPNGVILAVEADQ